MNHSSAPLCFYNTSALIRIFLTSCLPESTFGYFFQLYLSHLSWRYLTQPESCWRFFIGIGDVRTCSIYSETHLVRRICYSLSQKQQLKRFFSSSPRKHANVTLSFISYIVFNYQTVLEVWVVLCWAFCLFVFSIHLTEAAGRHTCRSITHTLYSRIFIQIFQASWGWMTEGRTCYHSFNLHIP